MSPMTTEMLKKGYLLFPKALFEEQMNMKTGEKAADAFEAFVFVLTHVNYSTVTCNVRGHLFDCVRGESVLSLARWMEILGDGPATVRATSSTRCSTPASWSGWPTPT